MQFNQESSKRYIVIANSTFSDITGHVGAAMAIEQNSLVTLTGNNTFRNIDAVSGGAISLTKSELSMNGYNLFYHNRAIFMERSSIFLACSGDYFPGFNHGGSIVSKTSTLLINSSSFINNFARDTGGAIYSINTYIRIHGPSSFHSNLASQSGGAISFYGFKLECYGNVSIVNNTAEEGGALNMHQADVTIDSNKLHNDESIHANVVTFHRNTASILEGGSIRSISSNLTLKGSIQFVENLAFCGGAIALLQTSKLNLIPSVNITFILNDAEYTGGALYVDDDSYTCSESQAPITNDCFISIRGYYSNSTNISLVFVNNSAAYYGSTLYGGELNKCRLWFIANETSDENRIHVTYYTDNALGMFLRISEVHKYPSTNLNISSPAQQIKFCQRDEIIDHNTDNMDIDDDVLFKVKVYPGGQFHIPVIATGQANSAVPARLLHIPTSTLTKYLQFRLSPESQNLDATCTNASLRLYSSNVSSRYGVRFKLFPDNRCRSVSDAWTLKIFILPCPLGFILSEHQKCTCDGKISKYTLECYVDTQSIGRMHNNFWISKGYNDTIIIHEFRCPLDYCKSDSVNITLESPFEQCDFNRNGTICGHCKAKFSLALGTLHCLPCSNHYTVLLSAFALAGVFLVALLFMLHLTVAAGTLSGLIFYANIVQANHQAFFPQPTVNFATYFISWLNLDLGIETCFYNGMDIYSYSWFQFLFPFYIWLLIGVIILASRYSKRFAEKLGQNPVAVLATLLLLSYSKILKAIITPLSWTNLTYYNTTDEYRRRVWLYDGSVDYFQEPKHIILGLFAILVLVFLAIPYIFLLLCGYWLQGFSNWRVYSWLNKIKPIMDAYYAPYKKGTRYWIGLLLISRLGLFLTFAINTLGNASINILAISTVTAALLAIRSPIYEHQFNDILESVFLLNLCTLKFSIATFYLSKDNDKQSQILLSSISVGIAFLTFIVIIFHHLKLRIRSTNIWTKHCKPFIDEQIHGGFKRKLIKGVCKDAQVNDDDVHVTPTSTVIDIGLREPLIELDNVCD